jgi:hypothetical protein
MLLQICEFVGANGVQCGHAARIGSWHCVIHEARERRSGKPLTRIEKDSLATSGTRISVAMWELVRDGLLSEANARRVLRQFYSAVGYGYADVTRGRSRTRSVLPRGPARPPSGAKVAGAKPGAAKRPRATTKVRPNAKPKTPAKTSAKPSARPKAKAKPRTKAKPKPKAAKTPRKT